MHVLLVEDDPRIADLVQSGLYEDGHQVSVSRSGTEGEALLLAGKYDAAILDILLPGRDGLAILESVRSRRNSLPILMLTAVDVVPKILEAFELGADDYLVKPFLLEILLARVNAIVRRGQPSKSPPLETCGVMLDRQRRLAVRNGREIALTRKQVDLLERLMRRCGLVTSREELIEAGWGRNAEVKDNTLDVYIRALRNKLAGPSDTQTLIHTIHGSGYCFFSE